LSSPVCLQHGYVLGAEFGVLQSPTIDNPVIADEWHTRLAAPVLLGVFFNLGCSGVDAGYVMYRSGQTNL
jgi:hypothetical protein